MPYCFAHYFKVAIDWIKQGRLAGPDYLAGLSSGIIWHGDKLLDGLKKELTPYFKGKSFSYLELTNILMTDAVVAFEVTRKISAFNSKLLLNSKTWFDGVYMAEGGSSGHIYNTASVIHMGNDFIDILKNGKWFLPYLACVHPDTCMMKVGSPLEESLKDPKLRLLPRARLMLDRHQEAKDGHDAIVAEIEKEGKIPYNLVLWISGNLVYINQPVSGQTPDGRIMVSFQATTHKIHGLSGQATHCFAWDPKQPDKIVYTVYGTGQGNYVADKTNGYISAYLWRSVGELFPYMFRDMKEQGKWDTEARFTAYSRVRRRQWQDSPLVAIRGWTVAQFMTYTLPAALFFKAIFTDSVYNRGAVVPYKPWEAALWVSKNTVAPGNEISIEKLNLGGVKNWDELRGKVAMDRVDDKSPKASDTMGGVRSDKQLFGKDTLGLPPTPKDTNQVEESE